MGCARWRRDKVFALLAVTSLALGIGANTAIYSFMDSILLRPLPVTDPRIARRDEMARQGLLAGVERHVLVDRRIVMRSDDGHGEQHLSVSRARAVSGERRRARERLLLFRWRERLSVTVRDATDSVKGQYVSGNYFQGMGVAPAAGRLIQASDDAAGSAAVAVVSHRFSLRRFGDAHAAVGQTIRINDQPFVVIGVAPRRFFGAEPGAIAGRLPAAARRVDATARRLAPACISDEHYYWIEIMGRLKPGVSLAQAQAVLAPAFHQFAASSATTEKQKQDLAAAAGCRTAPPGLDSLRRRYAQPIYVLMAMVALILLIACSNIANLLLARSAARRREIAVRLSVGASRWRVIRQLLTESVLLSSIGGPSAWRSPGGASAC